MHLSLLSIQTRLVLLCSALMLILPLLGQAPVPAGAAAASGSYTVYLPLLFQQHDGTAPSAPPDLADVRAEVIRLANIERVKAGCPAAVQNQILMSATQEWSVYMLVHDIFAHSNTVDPGWYAHRGYVTPHLGPGENIAGALSAQQVIQMWMSDPPHRAILLDCMYAPQGYVYEIGAGAALQPNGLYRFTLGVGMYHP